MKVLKVILEDLEEVFGILIGIAYLMWLMSGFGLIPLAFGIIGTYDTGEKLPILMRVFLILFCIAGWIPTILMYIDHIKDKMKENDKSNR